MGMLDKILGDATLGAYKEKSKSDSQEIERYNSTRRELGISTGGDELVDQTNRDLAQIRATQIKAAEAIESTARLEKGAATEFKGLVVNLTDISESTDSRVSKIM